MLVLDSAILRIEGLSDFSHLQLLLLHIELHDYDQQGTLGALALIRQVAFSSSPIKVHATLIRKRKRKKNRCES